MPRALIIHSEEGVSKTFSSYLVKRGIQVHSASGPNGFITVLKKKPDFVPVLVIIDLTLADDGWLQVYQQVTRLFPQAMVLVTTDRSDPNLIMRAKVHGIKNFLRPPYTEEGLMHALRRMSRETETDQRIHKTLPKVQVPVRIKITFPYAILALLIILGAAFLASRVAVESVEERFANQLVSTAKLSADWMVREEDRLLSTLRLIRNTSGMVEAVQANNAEQLRTFILPVAVNSGEEVIAVLNSSGENLITLQHVAGGSLEEYEAVRGSVAFIDLEFVRRIYAQQVDEVGDKYAGLATHSDGVYFYVAGPIRDPDGNMAGIILVGKSTAALGRQMQEDTLAWNSFYDAGGQAISSTFSRFVEGGIPIAQDDLQTFLTNSEGQSLLRAYSIEGQSYREVIGFWEARDNLRIGLIGVALPETIIIQTSAGTNSVIFGMLTLALILVVLIGLYIANHISSPLMEVVKASSEVAQGNLDVHLYSNGNDEVAVLAHSFNRMIDDLREGSLYRDLLGRTVSPEIRDTLRDTLSAGNLRLAGQNAMASVMLADVQGFTTLSESEDPATVLEWLNELFGKLVPIITTYSGVVNEFSGDSLFAFFGILPRPLPMVESAYLSCRAGLDMLAVIQDLNRIRDRRGDPKLSVGIGINSGPVTAGGLGTEDRLHYTIIGDTVNSTQRIEAIAHQLPESSLMISKATAIAIWDQRDQFRFMTYGEHVVKGKRETLEVFRLVPKTHPEGYSLEQLGLVV